LRIFLDSSVLLAASGSALGASRWVVTRARPLGWTLVSSPYVVAEVSQNLDRLPAAATAEWTGIRALLAMADDVLAMDRPVIFASGKDRPILFTAAAWADVLLTLDRADFADVMGGGFYGLPVMTPAEFLNHERASGRLGPWS